MFDDFRSSDIYAFHKFKRAIFNLVLEFYSRFYRYNIYKIVIFIYLCIVIQFLYLSILFLRQTKCINYIHKSQDKLHPSIFLNSSIFLLFFTIQFIFIKNVFVFFSFVMRLAVTRIGNFNLFYFLYFVQINGIYFIQNEKKIYFFHPFIIRFQIKDKSKFVKICSSDFLIIQLVFY